MAKAQGTCLFCKQPIPRGEEDVVFGIPFHKACREAELRGEPPPPNTPFKCGGCHKDVLLKDAVEFRNMAFHPACLRTAQEGPPGDKRDGPAFNAWVANIHAVSRERYDATPEEMYGRQRKKLGQSVRQFYRDWYPLSTKLSAGEALAEIITDIELTIEQGVGTLSRGEK